MDTSTDGPDPKGLGLHLVPTGPTPAEATRRQVGAQVGPMDAPAARPSGGHVTTAGKEVVVDAAWLGPNRRATKASRRERAPSVLLAVQVLPRKASRLLVPEALAILPAT